MGHTRRCNARRWMVAANGSLTLKACGLQQGYSPSWQAAMTSATIPTYQLYKKGNRNGTNESNPTRT